MSNTIQTSVSLSVDDRTRHWQYFKAVPRTASERAASLHQTDMGGAHVTREVNVYDGRKEKGLTLDDASFELADCPTALSSEDFHKIAGEGEEGLEAKAKYYKEVEQFMLKRLGCDKVVCMHHQVRCQERMEGGKGNYAGYAVGGPHTDSSAVSGDMQAPELAKKDGDTTKYRRYLYVNLWRNISEDPIEDYHLACMDERTAVKPDDYVPKDLHGDGYSVQQYSLNARHSDVHKWYYYPKMTKNEAILFKQVDSDWTKSGRVCFHMAVKDTNLPSDSAPKARESIELRMFCFWKDADVDSMPTEENANLSMIQRAPDQLAKQSGPTVYDASAFQLVKALFMRIVAPCIPGLRSKNNVYSGNPHDYVSKFTSAINMFPQWPPVAKDWAKGHMHEKGKARGIEEITTVMVKDQGGYQGTTSFTDEQHMEITKILLENAAFQQVCHKHLAPLASED